MRQIGGPMRVFKFLIARFFKERPFFYSWEQRAFERRQEQCHMASQNACRPSKD